MTTIRQKLVCDEKALMNVSKISHTQKLIYSRHFIKLPVYSFHLYMGQMHIFTCKNQDDLYEQTSLKKTLTFITSLMDIFRQIKNTCSGKVIDT